MSAELLPVTSTPLVQTEEGLTLDGVPLVALARRWGTPLYVYSAEVIRQNLAAWQDALAPRSHLICYAVKANHNPHLLAELVRLGAGFDIVSGGEFELVRAAGAPASRVVFSGVGKRDDELEFALAEGIGTINVESASELRKLAAIAARMGVQAPVALRVNPDVDPRTHPYIATGLHENKFGIGMEEAFALYREAATEPAISLVGVACHIGSQLTELTPLEDAADRVMMLVRRLAEANIELGVIDLGGGIGIDYDGETPPTPRAFADAMRARVPDRYTLKVEPGRSIAGPAGVLLSEVLVVKENEAGKRSVVVDAAMNDLMRPSLYGATHRIRGLLEHADAPKQCDVVGPVCETGDFLARDVLLAAEEGDLLAVSEAGAYGYVMASNYNVRTRPPEIWLDSSEPICSRRRETLADLRALDQIS